MDDLPKTTLTQRRSEVLSGSKKLTKEKLVHNDDGGYTPDRAAIIRIAMWILVIVILGVGSAFFITNLLNQLDQNNSANSDPAVTASDTPLPVSLPTEAEENEETDATDETAEEPVEVTTPPAEETPTPAPVNIPPVTSTEDGLKTVASLEEYSAESRLLKREDAEKKVNLNKFYFKETATEFNYTFTSVTSTSGELDPEIALKYEGNDLLMEIRNVYKDNVTGNEGKTQRTFTNVVGITSSETSNKSGVSTYRFKMTKAFPSRVLMNKAAGEIKLQIDNR